MTWIKSEDSWRWQSTNPQGFGGSVPSTKMWLRLVNYAMAKKMKMWDVLQTVYLTGCKEKSKAHEAFRARISEHQSDGMLVDCSGCCVGCSTNS